MNHDLAPKLVAYAQNKLSAMQATVVTTILCLQTPYSQLPLVTHTYIVSVYEVPMCLYTYKCKQSVLLLCQYIHIIFSVIHSDVHAYVPYFAPSHFALSVPSPPQLQCHSMGGTTLAQPDSVKVAQTSHDYNEHHCPSV